MDRFGTGETNGTNLGGESAPVSLVAVLAACLAALEQEARPVRTAGGMPAWKRAALAELMNPGVRDFI